MIRTSFALLFLSLLTAAGVPANAQNAKRVALFETHFNDTSTEGDLNGIRDDEHARLELFDDTLRQKLTEAGYDLLDISPLAEEIDRIVNVANCNGCAVRMGEKLDADLVVTSEVQKVSNLILAINLAVYDVKTGKLIRLGSADIRGNTDTSWLRGQRWLLKNRILTDKP